MTTCVVRSEESTDNDKSINHNINIERNKAKSNDSQFSERHEFQKSEENCRANEYDDDDDSEESDVRSVETIIKEVDCENEEENATLLETCGV